MTDFLVFCVVISSDFYRASFFKKYKLAKSTINKVTEIIQIAYYHG